MRNHTFPLLGQRFPVRVADTPRDLAEFMRWVGRQTAPVAVDTEGKGLDILCGDPGYVRLVQYGTADEAWVIPSELGEPYRRASRDALRSLPRLVMHNAAFDILALVAHLGLDLDAMFRKTVDTQILAKLVDPRQVQEGGIGSGLKPLSSFYIDKDAADTQGDLTDVFWSEGLTKATGFAGIDLFHPTYVSYAGGDVILTSRLLPILETRLRELGVPRMLVDYEGEISRICGTMQYRGLVLDQEYTSALSNRLAAEAEEHTTIAAGFGVEKIGSPKQVAECLLAMGEEIKERTDTGAVQVNKKVLCRLADLDFQSGEPLNTRAPNPLALAVIKAKRAGKWRKAYAENFLARQDWEGRIHPNIQTMQARTGRMSITNPAVQTLPSGDWMIRRCLLAEEGHRIISCDFTAVEMRVLAALADVRKMKEAIANGKDLHDFTAELVYGPGFTKPQRKICKVIGLGQIFGAGLDTLVAQTGAPEAQVRAAKDKYNSVYPEIRRASRRWQDEAFANGMVTSTVTGRRLPLDRDRTYAVVNYRVQSTARDCLGQALIHMDERGLLPYLRLPIHDEALASAPKKDAANIAREMQECMTFELFGVPIDADPEIRGRSWGSAYMNDKAGKPDPDLLIRHDPYYAANPAEAYAFRAA